VVGCSREAGVWSLLPTNSICPEPMASTMDAEPPKGSLMPEMPLRVNSLFRGSAFGSGESGRGARMPPKRSVGEEAGGWLAGGRGERSAWKGWVMVGGGSDGAATDPKKGCVVVEG